jgi:hypothetical protein
MGNTCNKLKRVLIPLSEGDIIDLQGIEHWLAHDDCQRPRLGKGVRRNWLTTLSRVLGESNSIMSE